MVSRWMILAAGLLGACSSHPSRPAAADAAPPAAAAAAVSGRDLSEQDKADVRAVLAESEPGAPFTLDMSNPVHYRFFVGHMKRAGVTPDRYPQLFRSTESARAKPAPPVERRTLAQLIVAAAPGEDPPVVPIQTLTSLGTADGRAYTLSALSSVPSSPVMSMLTGTLYNAAGNPIGPQTTVQTSATQPASSLNVAAAGTLAVPAAGVSGTAVYFWEDQDGTPHHGLVQAVLGMAPTSITNLDPMPKSPAPSPLPSGWPFTRLCLNRPGPDCTYTPVGGSGSNVLMPVQGSVTFASAIDTSAGKLKFAKVTIARPDVTEGGGCNIFNTTDFFVPTTVINGNTITWNFSNLQFQPLSPCFQANSTAVYTLALGLTVGGQATWVSITSATVPVDPSVKQIPTFQIYQSCLPDGTMVRLKGGRAIAIEKVEAGQEIVLDRSGRTGIVESKVSGRERAPIVVLRTAGGRRLRATDGHPIITDRGPVLAGTLRPGDRVMTQSGLESLAAVSREKFDGYVWNLNIGWPPDSLVDPAVTGSTFLADGFVVGDNLMQFVENRRARISQGARNMRAAPPEWHRDIQSAIEDAR